MQHNSRREVSGRVLRRSRRSHSSLGRNRPQYCRGGLWIVELVELRRIVCICV